jgi:peroxiredoxin family protein
MPNKRPEKLSIIIFSGDFDKIHYALVMANAAATINIPVTLFFTMSASRALLASPENAWQYLPGGAIAKTGETGGNINNKFKKRRVATFEELLQACVSLEVKFMVCDMGLRAMDLEGNALRSDVPLEAGGMVTFFNDASANGQIIFI